MNTVPSFFGKFGNELEAKNKAELLRKLSEISIEVPAMSEGRTSAHRERFSIVRYIQALATHYMLEFPFVLHKEESPDFILKREQKIIGIEHRDAGSTKFHAAMARLEKSPEGSILETTKFDGSDAPFSKSEIDDAIKRPGQLLNSKGVAGHGLQKQWAELMLLAIKDKTNLLNQPHFKHAHDYELLLYDNTHVGFIYEQVAFDFLALFANQDEYLHTYAKQFCLVSIVSDNSVIFDVFGKGKILRSDE